MHDALLAHGTTRRQQTRWRGIGLLARKLPDRLDGGVIERARGILHSLARYARRNPVTAVYLAILLILHFWLNVVLSSASADRVEMAVSTNLDNLRHDPVGCLLGSALFFDGSVTHIATLSFDGTLITLVLGIGVVLAWLERTYGGVRAYTVFATGHIGATLIVSQVIRYALARGWYAQDVRHAYDFGISYGAEAAMAAFAFSLRRFAAAAWVVFVIAWPLFGASQLTPIPDFTTCGHLIAAALGFILAAAGLTRGRIAWPSAVRALPIPT
jgi:hypothetical protein